MATLSPNSQKQPGRALRCVEFSVNGGRRQRIKLGQVTGREGEDFRRRVEEIVADLHLGRQHDGSLCKWLNALSPRIQKRMVQVGLLKASRQTEVTLGDFLATITTSSGVKDATKTTYSNVIRNLIEHFGRSRPLSSIGKADAAGFKDYLQRPDAAYGRRPLSRPTVGRRIIMARQFFKIALEREMIATNPFVGVKGSHQRNPERLEFVMAGLVDQMIAATDDQDWKVLLALARYGGIRVPSEVVRLRWQDVDFARSRILIHSVKTEHHEGKEKRYIPLFDELQQPLKDAARGGIQSSDFVIQNFTYRQPNANLRTQFGRIARKAGVKVWGKAWQNMRATRETELIERIGLKDACKIIGNSEIIALQHYQMIRPQFLESAIERDREARKRGQNRGYKPAESTGTEQKAAEDQNALEAASSAGFRSYPSDASKSLQMPDLGMGDTGLEPVTSGV